MGYVSKEGLFFEKWMTEHEYEYDDIPIEELMQVYADKYLKDKIEELDFVSCECKEDSEIIKSNNGTYWCKNCGRYPIIMATKN